MTFLRLAGRLSMAAVLLTAVVGASVARDVTRLAAVVADGKPRGLVTVVVPVPEALHEVDEATFEVRSTGDIEILGRRTGYAVQKGRPVRPLVLTLRVPAGADAGATNAADVYFRSADLELIVPIVVRVALVRNVSIEGSREMRGLRLGDRLTLEYLVRNAGNAADTLMVDARGPNGWTVRLAQPSRIIVPARGKMELTVNVVVPGTANVGDHQLAVTVRPPRSTLILGAVYTTLGVTGRSGQVAGVSLRPLVAFAASSEGSAFMTGATVEGPLRGNTYLRAQLSPVANHGGLAMQGLSAVGAFSSPFNATLAGERWDIAAGNVGLQLSPLTGVNVLGQGVSARANTGVHEGRAIIARPGSGAAAGVSLLGAGLWRQTAYGRIGGSLSHLSEDRGFSSDRALTAVGADYTSNAFGTLTFGSSVAHRSSAGRAGVGYGASIEHERSSERGALRITHAPGGTAGFARATDELQFDFSRVLTPRWSSDVSVLRSNDAGPVFREMRVSSMSLGQRLIITPAMHLTLRGSSSSFDAVAAVGSIGDFGAADQSLSAGTEYRYGLLAFGAEGSYGVVTRSSRRFDGSRYVAAAAQRTARLSASRAFERWGALDGRLGLEMTDAGVGLPGEMLNAGVRWTNIPLELFERPLRLNAEASYQQLGQLQSSLVTRSSVAMALPWGLDVAVSAERNPFFRDAQGRPGWIAAMRVTASTRVYTPDALGPKGVVFEDRNQNSVRDAGEPGVAGVVVRRGEARARTDKQGVYRLPVNARGVARIDQASLPMGLLSHPQLAMDSGERLDLPVLPTATALLDLVIVPDDGGRIPQVDLEPAVVMLRDATGFEWVGRRTSPTQAEFSGVPMGTYTVVFNATRLREPLRADEQTVVLGAGESRVVIVQLRSRTVRVFTPQVRKE